MAGSPDFNIKYHQEIAFRIANGRADAEAVTASHSALLAEVERLHAAASDGQVTLASTLGPLIVALESHLQDAPVFVYYLGSESNPGLPCYYRGRHDDLAIAPHGDSKTVGELLTLLRQVHRNGIPDLGKHVPASDQTGVWIANQDEPSNQHVYGVRWDGRKAVILTAEPGR